MKQDHEAEQLNKGLKNNPTMLQNTINAISELDIAEIEQVESLSAFDPKEKIKFNNLKKNVSLINEYKKYYSILNGLYEDLERAGSIKKDKLLNNIKLIYIKVKGEHVQDSENALEIIRENSDNIFDDIYDILIDKMQGSALWEEDILFAVSIVMVDAFLRCKILEEPIV